MAVITANNLDLTFQTNDGPVHALKGVNLDIDKGDFVSFIGPSGCGKTTFLRCIAALETPTGGELSVNGNGGDDLLEEFDVNFLEFDERSIEDDFVGGLPAMFAQARAFNTNFNDAVVLFGFFNLAD